MLSAKRKLSVLLRKRSNTKLNDDELLRYSRHILLHELGIEGQAKLLLSHAVIIGAGGLGCAAALYLASSGVGRITLIDDDTVDLTNLQRQIAHTTDRINQSKVSSLASAILAINPNVVVDAIEARATRELLERLLHVHAQSSQPSDPQNTTAAFKQNSSYTVDVVLDCSDNFNTRHAVNAACALSQTPLISGSALKMDGQLSTFDTGRADSPCYACLFPPHEEPQESSCSTMGVFAPLVGIIGTAQANEALKILTNMGESLIGRLVMFNAARFKWTEIGFKRNPLCPVCSKRTAHVGSGHTAN